MSQRKRPKRHRSKGWKPFRYIAASVDYRGANDDELTFVFRGAPFRLIQQVFAHLINNGHGIAREAIIEEETDIVRRNGKGYYRVAVAMIEPDYFFASLDCMKLLIEQAVMRLYPRCKFQWFALDEWLNI